MRRACALCGTDRAHGSVRIRRLVDRRASRAAKAPAHYGAGKLVEAARVLAVSGRTRGTGCGVIEDDPVAPSKSVPLRKESVPSGRKSIAIVGRH